jgi:hypothetical protein
MVIARAVRPVSSALAKERYWGLPSMGPEPEICIYGSVISLMSPDEIIHV